MTTFTHNHRAAAKRVAIALAVVLAAVQGRAAALDVDEVQTLVRNNVAEEVIINMVRSDGTIYITHEQANELRAIGASENLVQAMRPTATTWTDVSDSPRPAISSPPTIITDAAPIQGGAPVIVDAQPATVIGSGMPADGSPISPVAITSSTPYPPRYDKEGWVSVSNHDWQPYYLSVNPGNKRMFLSKFPNGGMEIPSGGAVVMNLRKETYKLYGDTGEDLKVKVRENETTSVSLNPFGVFGNSGLTGVSVDRDKSRSEVLFGNYVPPPAVVIQEAPVVVVPPPPPPVYYHRPHYYRRHPGNSFYFGYRHW